MNTKISMGWRSCCCSCPWWPIHTQNCATWKNKRWKNYSFWGEFFLFWVFHRNTGFCWWLVLSPSLARSLPSLSLSLSHARYQDFTLTLPLSRARAGPLSISLSHFFLSLFLSFFLSLSLFSFFLSLARTLLSLLFLSHFLARYRYFTRSIISLSLSLSCQVLRFHRSV